MIATPVALKLAVAVDLTMVSADVCAPFKMCVTGGVDVVGPDFAKAVLTTLPLSMSDCVIV